MLVIKWIFSLIWSLFQRVVMALTVAFLLFIAIVSFFAIQYEINRKDIPDEIVLYIDFSEIKREHNSRGLYRLFHQSPSLFQVIKAIQNAKTDKRIKGIVANTSMADLSMAQIQELESVLADFRESKKFLKAYGYDFNHRTYYLASLFDEIWMPKTSTIEIGGYSRDYMFFKGFLEKIGAEAQIVKRHEYKSAPERFLRSHMSKPAKENLQSIYRALLKQSSEDIQERRNIDVSQYELMTKLASKEFDEAAILHFIDQFGFLHHMIDQIYDQYSIAERSWISPQRYLLSLDDAKPDHKEKIIILHLEGTIQHPGAELNENDIFPALVDNAVRDAIQDGNVKAIILRINSPGGSYLGSDQIWSALQLAKKNNIYIVASMGSMAASGGYYIATAADAVIAQPSTITGSIGIYGGKTHFQQLLHSIGITTDSIKIGLLPQNHSLISPYSDSDLERIHMFMDQAYKVFTEKVQDARGLTKEQVDQLARGRIWVGSDAKTHGLIDEIGGLDTAIKWVRAHLETDAYVEHWPVHQGGFFSFFNAIQIYMSDIDSIIQEMKIVMDWKHQLFSEEQKDLQLIYKE